MTQLTHDEKLNILILAQEARSRGDEKEALKISQRLPLAPHIAEAVKSALGAEYLKNSGFNLSEAEAAYGHNWINQ